MHLKKNHNYCKDRQNWFHIYRINKIKDKLSEKYEYLIIQNKNFNFDTF